MCILLKSHYAKFDVSRLFCSNVIEEKTFGGSARAPPPPLLVKEGLIAFTCWKTSISFNVLTSNLRTFFSSGQLEL